MTEPLRKLIRAKESRGDYNVVWGGIGAQHKPPRRLTTMTVQQVLDWQDSIDPLYNSEAAGAYQVMEDTLRGLVDSKQVSRKAVFNRTTQDKIADLLLKRRGLDSFLAGKISREKFANNLAKEWASFPVVSRVFNGKRMVNPGQSFYAGDGLNKALTTPSAVLAALDKLKAVRPSLWATILNIIMRIFRK